MRTLALSFLLLLGMGSLAFANPCMPTEMIKKQLNDRYHERVVANGMTTKQDGTPVGIMEVYVSPTGSFTVVLTSPDGRSCAIAAGESFDRVTPKRAKVGDPS